MGGDSVFIAGEEEDEGFESADDGSWLAAPPSTERKFVRAEVQALDEEISRLDSLLEPSVVDDESEGVEPFGPGPFPSEAQMRETLRKQEQILEEIKKGFAERRDNILRMYRNRKQQVKELLQQRPIINLLDKITFFTSIACLATTEFIILKKPQWITEWYTGWMLTLLAVRYKLYHRLKYHYFMLDFCYFTQGLFMFYVYYYPLPRLFVVLFSVSNGSLAWAIVAWRNSMVLHDLDKMTSVALHLFPTLVTFTLRWYPSDSSHSRVCYRPDCSLTFMDAVFSPLPVYLLWQAFYYMKTEIVDRDKFTANSDIQTSFRWLARSPGHPVYKLIRKAPENTRVLVFLVIQLLYTLLTALPVKFLFEYFYLHLAFIIGITGACVWNGGNYYVEYLWKRQMLQQGEKMGADVAVATSVCSTLYSPRFSHKAQLTSNVETCFDGATERTVVVKKVPKTWVLLPRMKKRMEAIRAIGPHENIVALYDALEQPTVMVFVYEHLTDGDLADHIPVNKGIGEEAAARVLVQIARGLSHMHTRGYVHRDIKPDNIGVERLPNGRLLVKIIDLEQATHVGESFLKAVGSIPYMAPELFSMRPASSIDLKACDAWSLGVVLYVLLCGRFPWQSARPTCPNFIRQTQGGCAVMEGLSAHIKEVLGGLLTVDCSKRWTVDMALRHMEAKWPDC